MHYPVRPVIAPQWGVQLVVTLLFPKTWPPCAMHASPIPPAGPLSAIANTSTALIVAEEVNSVALVAFLAVVGIALWATGHLMIR
jgi:hypothetical protein